VGQGVILVLAAIVMPLRYLAALFTLIRTGSIGAMKESLAMTQGMTAGFEAAIRMGSRMNAMLDKLPGALRHAGAGAEVALKGAKDSLGMIKAEMERLQAAEGGRYPRAGAVGTPAWPPATGGQPYPPGSAGGTGTPWGPPGTVPIAPFAIPIVPGIGGGRVTPTGNTYQANFYPTDWEAMRAAYENWERQGKEREERAGRTRGPL